MVVVASLCMLIGLDVAAAPARVAALEVSADERAVTRLVELVPCPLSRARFDTPERVAAALRRCDTKHGVALFVEDGAIVARMFEADGAPSLLLEQPLGKDAVRAPPALLDALRALPAEVDAAVEPIDPRTIDEEPRAEIPHEDPPIPIEPPAATASGPSPVLLGVAGVGGALVVIGGILAGTQAIVLLNPSGDGEARGLAQTLVPAGLIIAGVGAVVGSGSLVLALVE